MSRKPTIIVFGAKFQVTLRLKKYLLLFYFINKINLKKVLVVQELYITVDNCDRQSEALRVIQQCQCTNAHHHITDPDRQ